MVHRFTAEVGSAFTPLKDEMAELYRLWDETHRRVTAELARLQSAQAAWRLWEEQKAELAHALKQDSDTLKVSWTRFWELPNWPRGNSWDSEVLTCRKKSGELGYKR